MNEAASRIQVLEINGGSADALNYYDHKNGLSAIAIGGDKLSRGLTLEGLSVSYYLRASRMYDTLMQMGRWFGYRPGYVDLCRLFTSRELNEWFCHITLASEELRNEFNYMADVAGSTPEQYVLRVRTHPGVLQISASNKIRRAEYVDISWAGRLIESYQLKKDTKTIEANYKATCVLISELNNGFVENPNNYLCRNIDSDIIKRFLTAFQVSQNINNKVNPNYLTDFINVSNREHNELKSWNIALMTTIENKKDFKINNKIFKIGLIKRTNADEGKTNDYKISKNHIISPKDEFVDLDKSIIKAALKRTIELNSEYKRDYPKGEIVRNEFRNGIPLLILYFLNPKYADEGLDENSTPVIGFAISFPKSFKNPTVRFAVHQQLLEQFTIDDETDNSEEDEN